VEDVVRESGEASEKTRIHVVYRESENFEFHPNTVPYAFVEHGDVPPS